jgi:hypothetical protein
MLRVALAGLAALMLSAPAARAETAILTGAYGQADIARACQSAGGTPIGIAGVSYGCRKENCDGKGGTCSVECTDPQHCKAETPERIVVPTTLLGLLQNGDRVFRGGVTVDPGPSTGGSDPVPDETPPEPQPEPPFLL